MPGVVVAVVTVVNGRTLTILGSGRRSYEKVGMVGVRRWRGEKESGEGLPPPKFWRSGGVTPGNL